MFSTSCKRLSAEIFDQTMPLGRHWRLGPRAGGCWGWGGCGVLRGGLGGSLSGVPVSPRAAQFPQRVRSGRGAGGAGAGAAGGPGPASRCPGAHPGTGHHGLPGGLDGSHPDPPDQVQVLGMGVHSQSHSRWAVPGVPVGVLGVPVAVPGVAVAMLGVLLWSWGLGGRAGVLVTVLEVPVVQLVGPVSSWGSQWAVPGISVAASGVPVAVLGVP